MDSPKLVMEYLLDFFLINLRLLMFYRELIAFFIIKFCEIIYGDTLYRIQGKGDSDEDENIYVDYE